MGTTDEVETSPFPVASMVVARTMRTITLSDHTADKVTAAAAMRESNFADAEEAYRSAVALREAHLKSLRGAIATAWQDREFVTTLAALTRLGFAYMSAKPRPPVRQSADRDEIVWASGNEGERRVSMYLAGHLSEDWVLVSGYRNAKGEIDQVLIGPRGVFAIEIKFINGVVHCNGDRWWRDKYDRYGNLVESNVPIEDKRGRGPSKQLNDSANMLQSFLVKRAGINRVHRAVVLSHESSRLGKLNSITVDAVQTIDAFDLDRLFRGSSVDLDAMAVNRALQLSAKTMTFMTSQKFVANDCRTLLRNLSNSEITHKSM